MDTKKEIDEFLVLSDTNCLPRYEYHRSLLDWFNEGLPKDPIFDGCQYKDCSIIVGGKVNDEIKHQLFGNMANVEKVTLSDLNLGTRKVQHTEVLVVFIFHSDPQYNNEVFKKLRFSRLHGTLLCLVPKDTFDKEEHICFPTRRLDNFEVKKAVFASSDGLLETTITEMTCILEQRLSDCLNQVKIKLPKCSSGRQSIRSSLREVNAILRRLKQAACYPEILRDDEKEEESEEQKIKEELERFEDGILYHGYHDEKLYVITTDRDVKDRLEARLSKLKMDSLQFVVTVEDKQSISELSGSGTHLHGAKLVFVNGNVDAFKADESFATTGSLMLANNKTLMVAVTARHVVENKSNFFTLVGNAVLNLGQELPQPNNYMKKVHDDIAVIVIKDQTRSEIDQNCEKRLINFYNNPSAGQKTSEKLNVGEIVHKRGARTNLTTGTVTYKSNRKFGRFSSKSEYVVVEGRVAERFAAKGDSGSLVFKHTLSPRTREIDVYAMVYGKFNKFVPSPPIICFPFKESCDVLEARTPGIDNLQFFEG